MKKILVALMVISVLVTGCSAADKERTDDTIETREVVEYTINDIADEKNSAIGDFNKSYAMEDVSGGLSVVNIKKCNEVEVQGNNLKNAIVLECVSTLDVIRDFLEKSAYFELVLKDGTSSGDVETATSTGVGSYGEENVFLYLKTNESLEDVKYLVIGGAKDRASGLKKVIFMLSDEIEDIVEIK